MDDDKTKNNKISTKNSLKNIIKENEIINNNINNNNSNNNIFKKIENNNHTNHILNNKNKDKNLISHKQKNLFLNNKFTKFNHVNRIINLKSLNDHYNSNNNLKESFFSKYKKFDMNSQNNRQMNEPYKKEEKCISAFDSMLANNKNNSEELNNINNNQQNINHGNIYNNKKINIKNDDTPSSGSTFAYSKKYNSNSINNQNMTEDHNNKFRMGLLSAFPNCNNNIIIPLLPVQRPLSNFNLGGGQLWENIDNINNNNIKIEQNNKQTNINNKKMIINNINIIDRNKINNDMRPKIGTAPSQKREFNYFSNNDKDKNLLNKNYRNIFSKMSNYGPKFHQIIIDKSLMNNKLSDSLNKNILLNYMSQEQNKLPKITNNHFYDLKKLSNIRNNSTKN